MKSTIYLLVFFVCSLVRCQQSDVYLVQEIKSKNSWNIIYLKNEQNLFKVVNKKIATANCKRIKVGAYYKIRLRSSKESVPEIDGVKLAPINKLDVECYSFDELTEICIEPDKGINEIHITDDLVGLCLRGNSRN